MHINMLKTNLKSKLQNAKGLERSAKNIFQGMKSLRNAFIHPN